FRPENIWMAGKDLLHQRGSRTRHAHNEKRGFIINPAGWHGADKLWRISVLDLVEKGFGGTQAEGDRLASLPVALCIIRESLIRLFQIVVSGAKGKPHMFAVVARCAAFEVCLHLLD